MAHTRVFGLIVLLLLSACAPSVSVQVTRMGRTLPALPAAKCALEIRSMDMQSMARDYESLGAIALRTEHDLAALSVAEKSALQKHACRLGTSVLVPGPQTQGLILFTALGPKRARPLTLSGGPAAKPAAKPQRILAVFGIEDREKVLPAAEAEKLAEVLSTKLAEQKGYRVIPRAQLRKQLSAKRKESYRACYDSACQIELGKALAAQSVVASRVLRVGGGCTLTVKIYDLKTEATLAAASAKGACASAALLGAIERVARRLATD
jgi:hypothetical protein